MVIYDEYGPVHVVRTQEWKYVYRHAHGPHELYNSRHTSYALGAGLRGLHQVG